MALVLRELYCYNTEGERDSAINETTCRIGLTLFELQAETGIENRTIHRILREDLHLRKTDTGATCPH